MKLPSVRLTRGVPLTLAPLVRATDGGPAALATRVTLLDEGERLRVAFDCRDPEPWATFTGRDGPLWREEVVEVFLAPGRTAPRRYFEIEVNPLGAVFDARVESPHGTRRGMRVDTSWDCPGLTADVAIERERGSWRAELGLPWWSLETGAAATDWRVNFYRVDRPRGGEAEYSAWSPTGAAPADFHRPARFGYLVRTGIE